MKILLKIAWRNIWRNKGRSAALLTAIVIGLWAGVVTVGLMTGLLDQRIDNLIDSEIAHLQAHHPEFREEHRPEMVLPDVTKLTTWLDEHQSVRSYTARSIVEGMFQSPVKTSGVRIMGVDPERERNTTTFHENLVSGDYVDADIRNPVILGLELAEEHNIEIGNRIVLTFEQLDGELASAAFNVSGFFRSGSTHYDRGNVIVHIKDIQELLSEKPVFHEIAVVLHDIEEAESVVMAINEQFDGLVAQTWDQLSPELGTIVLLGSFMLFIVTMIIMIALAFGILNTMFMALFERIREIGMLISIGMSRIRVFFMIVLEAVMLTITGAAVGMLFAWGTITLLNREGVDLALFAGGIEEIGWPTVIYPAITLGEFFSITVVVITMTLLATLYPAYKAFRVNPMEVEKDT